MADLVWIWLLIYSCCLFVGLVAGSVLLGGMGVV